MKTLRNLCVASLVGVALLVTGCAAPKMADSVRKDPQASKSKNTRAEGIEAAEEHDDDDESVAAGEALIADHVEKKDPGKREARRPAPRVADPPPNDHATAPSDAVNGGGGGGFAASAELEGAKEDVQALLLDIEQRTASYREEFGVEEVTATQAPQSCDRVCDLSEAICKSSKRICVIAGQHAQEAYFAKKCQWSTDECKRAETECETCP